MPDSRIADKTLDMDADFDLLSGEEEATAALRLRLVILFHPDTSRIGETAAIACGLKSLDIGREYPALGPPGGSLASPINDPFVSRAALQLRADDSGWQLCRPPGASRLRVNGEELTDVKRVSDAQLRRGLVLTLAQRVVVHVRIDATNAGLGAAAASWLPGVSPAMEALRDQLYRAARSDDDVLLVGPTGTGKERVARAIHALSERAEGPWVAVNMAALPSDLASVSFFGARRGAYTGADKDREGFFQQAEGGTLFLDEVGDTPAAMQALLLRALQEREVQVVGGRSEKVSLRVVSAMEQPPESIAERFRPALRYRLGGRELHLPALADRAEDVGLLTALFLTRRGVVLPDCSDDARASVRWARCFEQLACYHWPGNVRELEHAVGQVESLADGTALLPQHILARPVDPSTGSGAAIVTPSDPGVSTARDAGPGVAEAISDFADLSDADFAAAWRKARFEVAALARDLGVSRQAIYRRLRRVAQCRLASDIPLGELLAALDACRGDMVATAEHLAVSRRALQTRLRASGLTPAEQKQTRGAHPDPAMHTRHKPGRATTAQD